MRDSLEPYLPWLEKVLGCAFPDTVTFEIELPIGRLVIAELLKGVPVDDIAEEAASFRAAIDHWELAPGVSPRVNLAPSHKRGGCIVRRENAWHAEWRECPIAVWMNDRTAFVAVNVPYVSFRNGLVSDWRSWLIVNRSSAASVLARLGSLISESPKHVRTFGGGHMNFTPKYDWDSVVLEPSTTQLVRNDFEAFFQREQWFREHGLPFRRGYLFYGPPGNGKSSVIKVMASHPAITPFTLDFCHEGLNNESLSDFFVMAAQNAPSLVILEDLDRAFVDNDEHGKRPKVTLQHFLNCLDGVGTEEGLIVVATANDPTMLDAAILKRPGRFDRVVAFRSPSRDLCADYLHHLSRGAFAPESLNAIAGEAEGLSFAQLRECYILAGQLAYESCSHIGIEHVRSSLKLVGREMAGVHSTVGFQNFAVH